MIKDSQEHLNEVNETYFQHMRIAFKIGFTMLVTGVFCLVHGLIPRLFKKTGSNQIAKMYEMVSRN
jgi:hypothetical protein